MTDESKKYPFTVPAKMPYTNNSTETNSERLRIVACDYCKYQMWSSTTAARCGVCGHEMITVVKS